MAKLRRRQGNHRPDRLFHALGNYFHTVFFSPIGQGDFRHLHKPMGNSMDQ